MDCQRVQEILLAALDGDVAEDVLFQADSHCSGCPECARLRRGLQALAASAPPTAPPDLEERVLAAVADARAQAEAERAALEAVTAAASSSPPRRTKAGWERRFAALAAAVAVVVVGLVVVGLTAPRTARVATQATLEKSVPEPPSVAGGQSEPDAERSAEAYDATAAVAPPYVAIEGRVFVLVSEGARLPSSATTIGLVVSAFDEVESEPVTASAYADPASRRNAYVLTPAGRILLFRPVTRRYAGREYVLVTDAPIARFGDWPSLPSRFPTPAAADGTPVFRCFGSDDHGVRIFVPPSAKPRDGFAIAPGTAPDDPAAGNPNWTWWEPLD